MSQTLHIELPDNWICPKHWMLASIQPDPIEGLKILAGEIIRRVAQQDKILRECGGIPELGQLADSKALNWVLPRYIPLCCHLGDTEMDEVYKAVGFII